MKPKRAKEHFILLFFFWFYAKNLLPSLPDHREDAPVPTESWKEEVDDTDMPQIQDLLKKIRTQ